MKDVNAPTLDGKAPEKEITERPLHFYGFNELYQSYIDCITTPCSSSLLLHYDSFFIKYARIEMCFTNVLPIIDFRNFSILQVLDAMLHLGRLLRAE